MSEFSRLTINGARLPELGTWAPPIPRDVGPITEGVLRVLKIYTDWIAAHAPNKGAIGEVGWPISSAGVADSRWNGVGEAWFQAADAAHLDVHAWSASTLGWGGHLPMVASRAGTFWPVYLKSGMPYTDLNQVGPGWAVVAQHLSAFPASGNAPLRRGIGLPSALTGTAETGQMAAGDTASFSNARETLIIEYTLGGGPTGNTFPIAFGFAGKLIQNGGNAWNVLCPLYNYGSLGDYRLLAALGVRYVRLNIRWERVQRILGGALDTTELARIDQAIAWANSCGIRLCIDIHNSGGYFLDNGTQGVSQVLSSAVGANLQPLSNLVDFWTKLSAHFKAQVAAGAYGTSPLGSTNPIEAYELMNEPGNMTVADWISCSQQCVDAIRTTNGDTSPTLVVDMGGGGSFSNPANMGLFASDWIAAHDSTGNYRFKVDMYFNLKGGGSGVYADSFDTELAWNGQQGQIAHGYPLKSLPASTAGSFSTTSTSAVPIVTTGAASWSPAVTFFAPQSGAVELEFSGLFQLSGASTLAGDNLGFAFVCTAGGGPTNVGITSIDYVRVAGQATQGHRTIKATLSGLTPGVSYTYKPEIWVNNARLTGTVFGSNLGTAIGQFKLSVGQSGSYPGV